MSTLVRSLRTLIVPLALFTLAAGCKSESGDPAGTSTSRPAAPAAEDPGHAPASVKPGSHDDWCAEHAVPESQCTRCNPDLIPAFKATDDWCAEHGLPESQCTICNPELVITRPPEGS